MRAIAIVLAAGLIQLFSACTSNKMYRCELNGKPCAVTPAKSKASSFAKEYRKAIEDHGDYKLSFIELDDQGWFYEPGQLDALMEVLNNAAKEKRDVVISVFVHGWRHNADYCDTNVCCFRDTLKHIHNMETKLHGREVIGVYVGWRGLSNRGGELWEYASFYSRMRAAQRVALGSVREVFARLKHFQDKQNGKEGTGDKRTRLMILGHSFGGLIVYAAVSQFLMTSAVVDEDKGEKELVRPYGDLVVLVNPAFEAARFEPLFNIAKNRKFPTGQHPVFVLVTSKNDDATKYAFPTGRWISALFQKYTRNAEHTWYDQWEANVDTVGHLDRYRTHHLGITNKFVAPQPDKSPEKSCACPYASGIGVLAGDKVLAADKKTEFDEHGRRVEGSERLYVGGTVSLKQDNNRIDPNNPFWVVSADKQIINGHNDFFTPSFLGFLRELYDQTLIDGHGALGARDEKSDGKR